MERKTDVPHPGLPVRVVNREVITAAPCPRSGIYNRREGGGPEGSAGEHRSGQKENAGDRTTAQRVQQGLTTVPERRPPVLTSAHRANPFGERIQVKRRGRKLEALPRREDGSHPTPSAFPTLVDSFSVEKRGETRRGKTTRGTGGGIPSKPGVPLEDGRGRKTRSRLCRGREIEAGGKKPEGGGKKEGHRQERKREESCAPRRRCS